VLIIAKRCMSSSDVQDIFRVQWLCFYHIQPYPAISQPLPLCIAPTPKQVLLFPPAFLLSHFTPSAYLHFFCLSTLEAYLSAIPISLEFVSCAKDKGGLLQVLIFCNPANQPPSLCQGYHQSSRIRFESASNVPRNGNLR
jgi:hypothetical protein